MVIGVVESFTGSSRRGQISIVAPSSVTTMPVGLAGLFSTSRFWLLAAPVVITGFTVSEATGPSLDERGETPTLLTLRCVVVVVETNPAERRGVHRNCVVEVRLAALDYRLNVAYRHCLDLLPFA